MSLYKQYANIHRMLLARGLDLDIPQMVTPIVNLTKENRFANSVLITEYAIQFEKEFATKQYISVTDRNKEVIAVIVREQYLKGVHRKLMSDIGRYYKSAKKVIIVANESPNISTQQMIDEDPLDIQFIRLRDLVYDPLLHILTPEYRVIDRADFEQKYSDTATNLPKKRQSDPISRWFGLKPGDIIRVTFPGDENAPEYIEYQEIVQG